MWRLRFAFAGRALEAQSFDEGFLSTRAGARCCVGDTAVNGTDTDPAVWRLWSRVKVDSHHESYKPCIPRGEGCKGREESARVQRSLLLPTVSVKTLRGSSIKLRPDGWAGVGEAQRVCVCACAHVGLCAACVRA